MDLTLDKWKTFATKFLADLGVEARTGDWTDIEIAIHQNAGYQGISKRFLLMAVQLIRDEEES